MKYSLLLSLLFSISAFATDSDSLLKKAQFFCSQITENPELDYQNNFTERFRNAVPEEKAVSLFRDLFHEGGPCTGVTLKVKNEDSGKFLASTAQNKKWLFFISLDESKTKIEGLRTTGNLTSDLKFKSLDDLKKLLEKMPGQVSVTLKFFDEADPLFSYHPTSKQALGSAFKLYVLGTLVDQIKAGLHTWEDSFPIQESLKSFPSGVMHKEAEGTLFTLSRYAANMISISDNTATDHLLEIVGREAVEKNLTPAINSFADENTPFLSTMDMFRSRTLEPQQVNQYVLMSADEKRDFMQNLRQNLSHDKTRELLNNWESPRYIDKIEWFASTDDMCNTMKWLKEKESTAALDILGINTPFIDLDFMTGYQYAGYKGGSEPGVLTMTYLFQTKNNKWGCFSFAANDSLQEIDENMVDQTVQATLQFIGN